MSNTNLPLLIKALDAETKEALESAAQRCIGRGGSEILIEDMLLALLEPEKGYLTQLTREFEISREALFKALTPMVRNQPAESSNPVFSPLLVKWLEEAFTLGGLSWSLPLIITGTLILAILKHNDRYAHTAYYELLSQINPEKLNQKIDELITKNQATSNTKPRESALKQFTHNLTVAAREGKIDPVFCRDHEIRQMIDILTRRRKNNPIAVGEAGVGKTAVVEGLALRIAEGLVPDPLKNVDLLNLDLGLLQAGASVKGEYERRLRSVIDAVRSSSRPIVLFIDEAHTLVGAGNQAGGGDAANLLKPALARGELRTIAATTWPEYKKYFEKDAALARRFQPVKLMEPTVEQAVTIMRGLAGRYSEAHGVFLRDDAVVAAAELSAKYLSGRQLPDKAIDVLDTACARVQISLNTEPAELQDLSQRAAETQRELDALKRDSAMGIYQDKEHLVVLKENLRQLQTQIEELRQEWQKQSALARRLLDLRKQRAQTPQEPKQKVEDSAEENNDCTEKNSPKNSDEMHTEPCMENSDSLQKLQKLHVQLQEAQAQKKLVYYEVEPQLVGEVIAHWTGIPLGTLLEERSHQIVSFPARMKAKIKGQDHAIDALFQAVQAEATGLNNPHAPTGVFLFAGPSGVGKTETAIAIAKLLYGGERFLTTINMSEFQEKHSISRLIGSPPGYVGFGEGGVLTEAVRQKPYSVILLDEIEKAAPDVLNLFYQVFDKGVANDGEGLEVDFRNTLILMTTNMGAQTLVEKHKEEPTPDVDVLKAAIKPEISHFLKPALLARMTLIPYLPIGSQVMQSLVRLKLERLAERLERQGKRLQWDEILEKGIAALCTEADSGARNIDYLINTAIMPALSQRLLENMGEEKTIREITISQAENGSMHMDFS